MKLLLHACCGPCLLEPLDALLADGHEVTVAYVNPNIHPAEEFERRRDTLLAYTGERGVRTLLAPYRPEEWALAVACSTGGERIERCRACYALRLGAVARLAAETGGEAIATTLTVSPYQDAEAIRAAGLAAAGEAGVGYLHRDFRERYAEATRRSRELGMYRQGYCGCAPSAVEAEAEREGRRAARRAAAEAKRSGGLG